MVPKSVLVANRGEIAIRIIRAAAELGIRTVAVFSEDDAGSLHTVKADEARQLRGVGAAAYLDAEQIVAVAQQAGCELIHPGYGFLSENAAFARRCAQAQIAFAGPRPEILELFGDKMQARALAHRCGVPMLAATTGAASLEQAAEFFLAQGAGDVGDDQGGRRRRRPRDARGPSTGRPRSGLPAMPVRGALRVRQRRRLPGAADAVGAPYRSADPRRPVRAK